MNAVSLASTLSSVKTQQLGTEIGVRVLKNVMDASQASGEAMLQMMDNLMVPVDPNIGSMIDISI